MTVFIDEHRAVYGVEPICRVLPIAPSTDHEHAARKADPGRLPARERRDVELIPEVRRVFAENFGVYGVRKVWRPLKREGFEVARCPLGRLMRRLGLKGAVRGKGLRTTIRDASAPCPLDRVSRACKAPAPSMLWPEPAEVPPCDSMMDSRRRGRTSLMLRSGLASSTSPS